MQYEANNLRNAFFAVSLALVAGTVLMASVVGPAMTAVA